VDAYQQLVAMQGKDFHVEDFNKGDAKRFLVSIALELNKLTIVGGVPQMARSIMEPTQSALDFAFPVQVLSLRHRCLHRDVGSLLGNSQTKDGWKQPLGCR